MKKTPLLLVGLLFVLAIAVIGFVLGTYIGGTCCLPADSGLAGGAIVVGYGVLGSGIAAVVAALVAKALPPDRLVGITLVVGVVGGIFAGMLLKVYLDSRAQMDAHMQQAYAGMLKFRVALIPKSPAAAQPFRSIAFDWGRKQFKVTVNNQRCEVELQPEDAALMLGALRDVEGVVYRDPAPCADTAGDVQQLLDMYIPEASGDISKAKLSLTTGCLQKYPLLGEPMKIASDIFKRSDIPAQCQ